MKENILITATTGLVGVNFVKRLLEDENVHLYLLVRDAKQSSAKTRVESLLRDYYDDVDYWTVKSFQK